GQLALHFVLDVLEQVALHADAVAVQIPGIEALDGPVRRVPVHLHLHLEVDARDVAEAHRRMLLPHEAHAVALLDRLLIDRLVGRRVGFLRRLLLFLLLRLLVRAIRRLCGGRLLHRQVSRRVGWNGEDRRHADRDQHCASPPALCDVRGDSAAVSRTSVNRSMATATAPGSVTTMATSRRKSRLSAASARLPTTAVPSSISRILPCDLSAAARLPENTSTSMPAARLALSSATRSGSESFASRRRMLRRASSMSAVN